MRVKIRDEWVEVPQDIEIKEGREGVQRWLDAQIAEQAPAVTPEPEDEDEDG